MPTSTPPFSERGGKLRGVLDLATGCYPAFLFGGSDRGVLPVFHFHEVTREWLEPRLAYLADNGYRTVTSDGVARFVIDRLDPGPHRVCLTFDDAWSSAWTVATPLLRKYGLQAILFAIPARVAEADAVRPEGSSEGPVFATWPELRAMHECGAFDVQSHTRSHWMIFSNDQPVDFVTPSFVREPLLNRPLLTSSDGVPQFLEPEDYGAPIYVRRSRMSDARRFVPDPMVAEQCRARVADAGVGAFFERPGWRRELESIAADGRGRFENDSDRTTIIRAELAEGRALLNEHLRVTSVRHVALPWGIAGEVARGMLAETGHETAFAERPLRRRGVRAGDDRYQLMRLSSRFLTCLPGRGRQWFFTTV